MSDIPAINWTQRFALLSDGSTVPVTNLFTIDGEETDDPDEAFSFVAGSGDQWFSGRCDDYEEVPIQ